MAQGYYGTDSNPLAELHSERKVITPQTSGGSIEEGRYRLRTDLNSGDRIATYEINVGNGVEEAPVFPVSASAASGIQKYRQTYVPGEGWGFVPVADEDNYHVTYPQLQMYHDPSGAWYGWHDSLTVIPDSVVYQWAINEGSGQTLASDPGGVDISVNFENWVSDNAYYGGWAKELDGTDDTGTTDQTFSFYSDQFAVALVYDNFTSTDDVMAVSKGDADGNANRFRFNNPNNLGNNSVAAQIRGDQSGDSVAYQAAEVTDGNLHSVIQSMRQSDDEARLYFDGDQKDSQSGTTVANDADSTLHFGDWIDGGFNFPGRIVALVLYDTFLDSTAAQDEHDRLVTNA